MRFALNFIALVLLFLVGLTLATQNMEEVTLHYYFGVEVGPLPLYMVLLTVFIVGMLFAVLLSLSPVLRLRLRYLKMKRDNLSMTKELERLRNLPLEQDLE
ncbi:MAG: hypothetical protein COX57_13220 [Alphaproteobacteria bacterium CG_4_10_14_0_2_um_filter_63_37]|nr:MAG: hypothetical protein AUJ55_04370 [Proteobacteria bacterium CG1_02_64_396]PJA23542.1 MAG: hypothetical protein COX57_13220 [Alphaproteobacteria bacterium CG_4_10_14_0_2_um_filter_63_37]